MSVKTKNELLEEIEKKNEEIEVLKTDVKKLEKYRKYDVRLRLSMTVLSVAVSQNSRRLNLQEVR